MENPVLHTMGYVLLHYGLMIDRPSSLKVEIWSTHVDIGLRNWKDILLLSDLLFKSSCALVGVGRC